MTTTEAPIRRCVIGGEGVVKFEEGGTNLAATRDESANDQPEEIGGGGKEVNIGCVEIEFVDSCASDIEIPGTLND
jgi:hypothetical protein